MLFNYNIDNYLLDFLSLDQLKDYMLISKSTYNLFKKSEYYYEIKIFKEKKIKISIENICKYGTLKLLKSYFKNRTLTNYNYYFTIATRYGHLNIVKYLNSKSLNIKEKNEMLFLASSEGHINIIYFLIFYYSYELTQVNWAIYNAATRGHLHMTQFLVSTISKIEDVDLILGMTSKKGHLDIVRYFILQNFPIKNYFAFEWASKEGRLEVVRYLSFLGNIIIDINCALRAAVKKGHMATVKFLILQGADITDKDNYAINKIAKNGYLSLLQFLISNTPDVSINYNFIIQLASKHGHLNIVRFLISRNVDFTINNNCSVRYAAEYGHLDVVKFLFFQNANILSDNNYAIRYAAGYGRLDVVKFLVYQGADTTADNNYAYRSAYNYDHHEVFVFLLYFQQNKDTSIIDYSSDLLGKINIFIRNLLKKMINKCITYNLYYK